MLQKPNSSHGQSNHFAHKIANELVDALCAKIAGEIPNGSTRSLDIRIRKIVDDLHTAVNPLSDLLQHGFEDYARARATQPLRNLRSTTLERILVQPIEHLFAKGADAEKAKLSRRLLPGLFRALNMMLGEETMKQYRIRAQKITEELSELYGFEFPWALLYENRGAKILLLDALIGMAECFTNFDRRINWLREIINSNGARSNVENDHLASWQLDREACVLLVREMFAPLIYAANNGNLQLDASRKLSHNDLAVIDKFVGKLNKVDC